MVGITKLKTTGRQDPQIKILGAAIRAARLLVKDNLDLYFSEETFARELTAWAKANSCLHVFVGPNATEISRNKVNGLTKGYGWKNGSGEIKEQIVAALNSFFCAKLSVAWSVSDWINGTICTQKWAGCCKNTSSSGCFQDIAPTRGIDKMQDDTFDMIPSFYDHSLRPIAELNMGYADADQYGNTDLSFFEKIIITGDECVQVALNPNKFFLVGDKGTGKTAIGSYFSGNERRIESEKIVGIRIAIDVEELEGFFNACQHITSGREAVWQLLFCIGAIIAIANEKQLLELYSGLRSTVNALKRLAGYDESEQLHPDDAAAIYKYALERANILLEHLQGGGNLVDTNQPSSKPFGPAQNVTFAAIVRKMLTCIKQLPLAKQYLIFIDNVDIKPENFTYEQYTRALTELAKAIIDINTKKFNRNNINKVKVVLVVRPDIFTKLNLGNANTKKSYMVMLNWAIARYNDYEESKLLKMAEQLLWAQQPDGLSVNQNNTPPGWIWHYYFRWDAKYPAKGSERPDPSFVTILKKIFYRPRDIITIMRIMQQIQAAKLDNSITWFDWYHFKKAERNLSNYILAEISEQVKFYLGADGSELLNEVVSRLFKISAKPTDRSLYVFSYEEFVKLNQKLIDDKAAFNRAVPDQFTEPVRLLSLLFELYIIGCRYQYFDKKLKRHMYGWRYCFKDRTMENLTPQVDIGGVYCIHAGVEAAYSGITREAKEPSTNTAPQN